MLVESWLVRAARTRPDHPALVTAQSTLTYAQLLAAARAADLPAGAGERVALSLPAGEGFAVALHACLLRGAVAVPVHARLGERERAAREAACAHVVREPLGAGSPAAPPTTHDLSAPALVVHTSGSRGAGTPVELTFANWLWSALGSSVALGHPRDERWLCALPLSHVGGLSVLLRAAVGATTVVLHERFDTETVLDELTRADGGPTAASLVPTTLARLLDAGLRDPPALRVALTGGAPIPPALLERARAAGVPAVATYGLTEACSQVATDGAPLFCTRVRIEGGEILVAGPTVAPGALGADGWLHTGDLGMLDAEGRLTVTGRAADIIVTGGENVAPGEVEAVLEAHPAVAEAAVHGRPDPQWGEAVVATVVLRAPAGEAELIAHCAGALATFQVPKAIAFVDALPRTASGKVRRSELDRRGPRAGQDG